MYVPLVAKIRLLNVAIPDTADTVVVLPAVKVPGPSAAIVTEAVEFLT